MYELGIEDQATKMRNILPDNYLVAPLSEVDPEIYRVRHRGISRAYDVIGIKNLDSITRLPGIGAVTDLLGGADLGGIREYEGVGR